MDDTFVKICKKAAYRCDMMEKRALFGTTGEFFEDIGFPTLVALMAAPPAVGYTLGKMISYQTTPKSKQQKDLLRKLRVLKALQTAESASAQRARQTLGGMD